MEELKMPISEMFFCYKPTFQNFIFYSPLASPTLPQKRSQCDFAESEGQTGALLCVW